MRITNQMILSRSLASIQDGLSARARLERQITTGERIQNMSDDPVAARSILDLDGDLRASEQYSRSIESARSRLAVADSTLQEMTNILTRVREIALQQSGGISTPETRLAARTEIQEMRTTLVQLGNQKLNGAYVFGGDYVDREPLNSAGALDAGFPARGTTSYEIGPGVYGLGAHDAGEMFIDSDVINSLDQLEAGIVLDDSVSIQAAADQLVTTIANVQELVAEIGARQIRLDVTQNAQSVVDQSRAERLSTLKDTSLEAAITELASLQSSYQATLLTTSRLLETSLVNFL
ncbi:MAG: flagellar hook-associated protein FlgL [Gemmatimonadota bacterium]